VGFLDCPEFNFKVDLRNKKDLEPAVLESFCGSKSLFGIFL
jgi:hypothetical protein